MGFKEWGFNKNLNYLTNIVNVTLDEGRYTIEVGFRDNLKNIVAEYSKILLSYVGQAAKNSGYHVRYVFDQPPYKLIVSSRNWENGEWVSVLQFNQEMNCFVIAKGFYKKETKSAVIQPNSVKKCAGHSPLEICKELLDGMEKNKQEKPIIPLNKFKLRYKRKK